MTSIMRGDARIHPTGLVARIVAAGAIGLGALVLLVGWGFDVERLISIAPGLPAMMPSTAAALVVAGIGCLALTTERHAVPQAICAVGLMVIFGGFFAHPSLAETASGRAPLAPVTALLIASSAVTIATGHAQPRLLMAVAVLSNLAGLALSLTVIEVRLLGSGLLGNTYGIGTMGLHTALGFLAVNVALLLAQVDNRMLSWIFSNRAQARLLKRISLVTVALIGVIFIGLLSASKADLISESVPLLQAAMFLTAAGAFLTAGFFIDDQETELEMQAALDRAETRVTHQKELAAEQEENLRVLGQIVGGVAHDFNNTLASIQGNLELISLDPGNKAHYSREAISAVGRAAELTNQLLAVGRKARAEKPVEDAAQSVRDFAHYFARALPDNVALVSEIDSASFQGLQIDAVALERSLMNLLLNARDAMPGGGTMRIRLSEQWIDNRFSGSFAYQSGVAPGRYALLEVSDTGLGMDRSVLRQATQPYFTTKGLARASGLGLASIRGISQQHGGGLLIASAPGKGTRVIMALPLSADGARPGGVSGLLPGQRTVASDVLILAVKEATQARLSRAAAQKGLSTQVVRTLNALRARLQDGTLPSFVLIGDQVVDGAPSAEIVAEIEARFPGVRASYVGQGGQSVAADPRAEAEAA
ncbi:MAG: ATP-binding protein [Pseudomonadota bacterium]